MRNRRGKFTLSRSFLEDVDFYLLRYVMRDVIVLHTETNLATDDITYWAIHPDFHEVERGAIIPEYQCTLTGTTPKWTKIF